MIFRLNLSWYRFIHFAFCLLTFLVLSLHSSFLPRSVLAESITAVGSEGLSASTHINITIIIPERIDIKIPAAIETDSPGGGDQQAVSNSGPLSVTVDQTSFTYVGTTKVDELRLSADKISAVGSEASSVSDAGSPPLITIASP